MERGCDHLDGTPMGMCAVCGKTVCSECYRSVFNEMICDEHEAHEEESAWALVGIYTDAAVVTEKRFQLEENGIPSIAVHSEEDAVELYVPTEEKDEGFAVLQSSGEEGGACRECRIQYSADIDACPLCGAKQSGPPEAHEPEE